MAKQKPISRLDLLVKRINVWSRPARISMTTFVTTLATLIIGYLILEVLITNPLATNVTPYVLAIGVIGVAIYAFGWYLLVGFDWNDDQPWQASRASAYYALTGLAALAVVLLALLGGLIFGYLL